VMNFLSFVLDSICSSLPLSRFAPLFLELVVPAVLVVPACRHDTAKRDACRVWAKEPTRRASTPRHDWRIVSDRVVSNRVVFTRVSVVRPI
jgi:hypothetical protein